MRDKPMPGFFELREAAEACFGRGQVQVDAFLMPIAIGDAVGRVSEQVERTSIQEEFYSTTAALGLPLSDSAVEQPLHLTDRQDVEASIFLHRLGALDVPYGHLRRGFKSPAPGPRLPGSLLRRIQRQAPRESDSIHLLSQLREAWTLQWSPATDISLIEKSILGNSLADVCRRLYRERLDGAKNVGQVSDVLLKIVLAGLTTLYDEALAVCERISANDEDMTAQARAAQRLQQLLLYGSTRALDQAPIAPLLGKVFARAAFLLPGAAQVSDDAVGAVLESIKILYEVARSAAEVDEGLLAERLARALEHDDSHPSARGLCAALLFLGGHLHEEELLRWLNYHLASNVSPLQGAQFLEGLLVLNRTVILRNPTVVSWLDTFVEGLSFDAFVRVLPTMRRAFSRLSRPELEYMISGLLDVLGLSEEEASMIGSALTEEEVAALNDEISRRLAGS
jgi:hypothetical protein